MVQTEAKFVSISVSVLISLHCVVLLAICCTNAHGSFMALQVQDVANKNKSSRRLGADGEALDAALSTVALCFDSFFRFFAGFHLGVGTR